MPRQVMVDAKKPISAQMAYCNAGVPTQALSAKDKAVPSALMKVSRRQSSRFIQNGAPSVPSK
jgi:hypothetical protein